MPAGGAFKETTVDVSLEDLCAQDARNGAGRVNVFGLSQGKPYGQRIGRFSIPIEMIEKRSDLARLVLTGCIVVRAESVWHRRIIEYVALHDDFEFVPSEVEAPFYSATLTMHDDRAVSVAWFNAKNACVSKHPLQRLPACGS